MTSLLQSTQTQATSAPGFYTDYLSNLASQGQQAAQQAQYAGAQPLQQQAFQQVGEAATSYKPTLGQAGDVLTQAAQAQSPLGAANPYLVTAATNNPALMAESYMSPYARMAAQQMSDIAQRNIQQNLMPQATAAAVGSGQFGSQRGAQVAGQVNRQAQQDLNAQIAQMLNQGYGQALQAAGQQQGLLGQLGSTAGQLSSAGQQNLTQAGGALGTLAGKEQELGLSGINALATLGGQQQTIAQNEQNYPLTKLSNLAALLQGQQIPSTVTTQLNMSPFSALASIGTGALGMMTPRYNAAGQPIAGSSPYDILKKTWGDIFPSGTNLGGGLSVNPDGSISGGSEASPGNTTGDPETDALIGLGPSTDNSDYLGDGGDQTDYSYYGE